MKAKFKCANCQRLTNALKITNWGIGLKLICSYCIEQRKEKQENNTTDP